MVYHHQCTHLEAILEKVTVTVVVDPQLNPHATAFYWVVTSTLERTRGGDGHIIHAKNHYGIVYCAQRQGEQVQQQ